MNKFNLYRNKTVLVTGHTGFKGSWLSAWLNYLGAKVIGISDRIPTEPSNYFASKIEKMVIDHRADLRNFTDIHKIIKQEEPDIIFNLAAQALVRKSYSNPIDTFDINAIGTLNVLEAVKQLNRKCTCVMITSDKVYRNDELKRGYHENDVIGGYDPYSASKGMAELVINSYVKSFFSDKQSNIRIAIGRAGNVIGGGDWASDRIVPDCIRAWSLNKKVEIRSPNSTRPWQHVLEPLSGYLLLGSLLYNDMAFHGEAFNFGPPEDYDYSVGELIDKMKDYWPDASWIDASKDLPKLKEAGLLKLDCSKAFQKLKWQSNLNFSQMAQMTIDWYKHFYYNAEEDISLITLNQIQQFTDIAVKNKLYWSL